MEHPLRSLGLKVFYDATGAELARDVLIPALSVAKRYDRVSAYFNLSSFISIGEGLDKLRVNGGRMRLLMGAHDVDQEMVDAALYSEAEKLVEFLRRRILTGVTKLSSELERNRIEAAAWMMRDGLLEVKCVAPHQSASSRGIFHNKRLIFVDETGDSITATGSVNETGAGLGGNFEELTIHTSWDSPAYTKAHMDRFETVWAGLDSKLSTVPLDSAFAQEILQALRPDSAHNHDSTRVTGMVVEALSLSPFLGVLNSSRAPLYPHQERVLRSVFSRWPIRALLADEVGLGKTYEAAAAISFALQHADVSRVVVLAPPTLLRQWQDEFQSAFGLNFWRYESSTREYISADGRVARAQGGPFRGDYPELVIVSRDLARGTRRLGRAFKGAERLVRLRVLEWWLVKNSLPFSWELEEYSPSLAAPGSWTEPAWREYVISQIRQESDAVKSFYLSPAEGEAPAFLAGQHLPVRLTPSDGEAVLRAYSLSTAPGPGQLRITVKKEKGGRGSGALHDANVGDMLQARVPGGEFVLDTESERPVALVSAGIGITPVLSMWQELARRQPEREVYFVHGARNGQEHVLREEVAQLAAPHRKIHFRYSRPLPGDIFDSSGRVEVDLLDALLPLQDCDFYLCGPPPLLESLCRGLEELGVPPERIHFERFGASLVTEGQEPRSVEFRVSKKHQVWRGGSLLELAEGAEIEAPFSCRSGSCGACRVRLLSGKVEYTRTPSFPVSQEEVLVCSAIPVSGDLVLEL